MVCIITYGARAACGASTASCTKSLLALAFVFVCFAAPSAAGSALNATTASVLCTKAGLDKYSCTIGEFSSTTWSARASLDAASINTTGWGRLVVESNSAAASEAAAYGEGVLEGFLTSELIDLSW